MTTDRYWYHPESDSAFIDNDPVIEMSDQCVEWSKEEYDQFIQGQKKVATMDLKTMESRYAALESESREVNMIIGQEEMRIDNALEGLREALPNVKFEDPRDIKFDELIADVQGQIDDAVAEIDKGFTKLEGQVESANTELQHVVGKTE